jgi:tetratricopeptide (TPR) repeat protein
MATNGKTSDPLVPLLNDVRRLVAARQPEQALRILAEYREIDPRTTAGWRALGDAWRSAGSADMAGYANLRGIEVALREPDMVEARDALAARDEATAEKLLRGRLFDQPGDPAALAMLGDLAVRARRFDEAIGLLGQALKAAPGFRPARQSLAFAYYSTTRPLEGLRQVDAILKEQPRDVHARELKASLLVQSGDEEAGIALFREVLAEAPERVSGSWQRLGHALKAVGRTDESIAAYRAAIANDVEAAKTWWSLANLKTYRFTADDIAAMRALQAREELAEDDHAALSFALGKAAEDAGEDAAAFDHYAAGNALRRRATPYDAATTTALRERCAALFDPAFFAARAGGDPSPEPIFVVGMPRAGSTLVERIIASHPLVEGTRELPFLPAIVQRLDARRAGDDTGRYPESLASLTPDDRRSLGREYLNRAAQLRRTDRPYFIDKLPNNFLHVGLIQLILPNARIVDARRHPMATGFSCWKQSFAHHQQFSYDLGELGRYYADYVAVMDAYDRALPGRVHRVIHERLVDDVEGQVRALLGYLRLPFDPACLTPHQTPGAVRTPSAEQVRRPIGREGADQWRRFEGRLAPLREALGEVVDRYEEA